MRISTGLRLFMALAWVGSMTGAFIACSGSDEQDVIGDDAGGTPDRTAPDASAPDTNRPDTSPPDTGPPDTGPQYDAGPPTVLDGGDRYEGGVKCVTGGRVEEEPNDDTTTANSLDPEDAGCNPPGCSRCGVIFVSDPDAGADAGELEYVKFQLHADTKDFFLQFAGDITMTLTVEGSPTTYTINKTSSPKLPFVRGKTYFVQVKSNTGKRTEWRVTLFELN